MKIKLLEDQVAAKIAAGEVMERPASVAKELIENSLDAAASRIIVEVRGGIDLIRVVDNGVGLPPDEVELAFLRHATSKLATAEDLEGIATLGFRGEALPSIAAVSRVHLVTREKDSQMGWEVSLRWGRVERTGPQGCPPGTSVTVSHLFENVPARRKFLRSVAAEVGRIGDLVSRYALAFPEVRFQLIVEGRKGLESPGSGRLEEALAAVYGAEVSKQMLEVRQEELSDGYGVEGYTSPISLSRSNRSHITFFVNRRWVQSRALSVALEEAYHGLLPQGRHPLSVINITVPYTDVDVNVHPTKREVRFRQESRSFSAVQRAVRAALIATSPVPQIYLRPSAGAASLVFQAPLPPSFPAVAGDHPQPKAAPEAAKGPSEVAPLLRVLGQAGNTYVVAEGPNGIFLLDQHAAHERVLHEKALKEATQGEPSVQALLEPVAVELAPAHLELVEEGRGELETQGFLMEHFGGNTYLLRAVPSIFRDSDPAQGLIEVLEMVSREGRPKDRREALAASIACHSAVRAGMSLTQQEMSEMVALLEKSENPHTCPHGRPIMLYLSSQHLEREFGRR